MSTSSSSFMNERHIPSNHPQTPSEQNQEVKALAAELAELATSGALSVSDYLREVARTIPRYDTKKDFHDPVTVHDRAVEKALHDFFAAVVPGSRVLGEEMGEQVLPNTIGTSTNYLTRDLKDRVRWIIDPIDGTANFAAGSTYFGTSIAAELDGEIVAAAICIPYTEEVFVANLEEAWHVDRQGQRTSLHSPGPDSESRAVISSYYPSSAAFRKDPIQAANNLCDLSEAYMSYRRYGAGALDLAMVSAGWLGAVMGASFGPWDVAAGVHLVKIAGGQVWSLPLNSDLPEGLRPAVLATAGQYEPTVAKRILLEADSQSRR